MLQTLTDITEEELKQISDQTVNEITTLGTDKETMMRVLGATEKNKNKTAFRRHFFYILSCLTMIIQKKSSKIKRKV